MCHAGAMSATENPDRPESASAPDLDALSPRDPLSGPPLRAALESSGAGEWSAGEDGLRARFATRDFRTGLDLVVRIGELAEAADHHPDVLLTYPSVEVTLLSHDVSAVTRRDVRLAAAISAAAQELGIDPL